MGNAGTYLMGQASMCLQLLDNSGVCLHIILFILGIQLLLSYSYSQKILFCSYSEDSRYMRDCDKDSETSHFKCF